MIASPASSAPRGSTPATTSVVLKATWYFSPGGNCVRQPLELGAHASFDVERVGGRQLDDAEADGVQPLEPELRAVGLGAELGAADVLEPDERAVGARLDDDVLEVGRFAQASQRADAELVRLAEGAGACPRLPAATCTFCSRSALTTSLAVSWRAASRSGSSHSRIEYLRSPKIVTSPTPGTRLSASLT